MVFSKLSQGSSMSLAKLSHGSHMVFSYLWILPWFSQTLTKSVIHPVLRYSFGCLKKRINITSPSLHTFLLHLPLLSSSSSRQNPGINAVLEPSLTIQKSNYAFGFLFLFFSSFSSTYNSRQCKLPSLVIINSVFVHRVVAFRIDK